MSMEVTRKQCTPNFPKNKNFLPPDNAHKCACGGVKMFVFQKIWGAFFSCYLCFWDTPFRLITDNLSNWLCLHMWWFTQLSHFIFSSILQHFYTPWKCQKTKGFLKFSGGVEMLQKTWKQWRNLELGHEIGSKGAATANPQPSRQLPV